MATLLDVQGDLAAVHQAYPNLGRVFPHTYTLVEDVPEGADAIAFDVKYTNDPVTDAEMPTYRHLCFYSLPM